MITGVHALFYTTEPEAARAFIRDKLKLPFYDEGEGWLIFDSRTGELACHPADAPSHGISLMCDDIKATVEELESRGVSFLGPIGEESWGWTTSFELPGGGPIVIYQPKPHG